MNSKEYKIPGTYELIEDEGVSQEALKKKAKYAKSKEVGVAAWNVAEIIERLGSPEMQGVKL